MEYPRRTTVGYLEMLMSYAWLPQRYRGLRDIVGHLEDTSCEPQEYLGGDTLGYHGGLWWYGALGLPQEYLKLFGYMRVTLEYPREPSGYHVRIAWSTAETTDLDAQVCLPLGSFGISFYTEKWNGGQVRCTALPLKPLNRHI